MCQNDPGCCDEWNPDLGGNKVLVTNASALEKVAAPDSGVTLREAANGCKVVTVEANSYHEAKESWASGCGLPATQVIGQFSGSPPWIQADETPTCGHCKKEMRFVAMLEEGPDWRTQMNFGDGWSYLFECVPCSSARFLWQC